MRFVMKDYPSHGILLRTFIVYVLRPAQKVAEEFSLWEPCHRELLGNGIIGFENVGGEIDKVTGKRVTIAAFPWRWVKGDACIVRMVAIVDPTGEYRL